MDTDVCPSSRASDSAAGALACSWTAQRHRPQHGFEILGTKGTLEFDTHER